MLNDAKFDLEAAKLLLRYEPETGRFVWLRWPGGNAKVGHQAGRLCRRGYRRIYLQGVGIAAHRLAWAFMTGRWPSDQIDHINGNRDDNRFSNLREATRSENMMNTKVLRRNVVGLKGVTPFRGRFRAQITTNGRNRHLGVFNTAEEAHAAYVKEAAKHFGRYARNA